MSERFVVDLDACPDCGMAWAYEVDGKRYSEVIGLYDIQTDRTYAWMCPRCNEQWPRAAVVSLLEKDGE